MTSTAKNEYYRSMALYYKNKARLKKCVAAVHLESDIDRVFWQRVFKHTLPGYSFDYITYSRTPEGKRATGCTTCLKYYHLGCLSERFFVCIDSDYRYLMQENGIEPERFVFQTYTYSLENHYCHPDNIERAFRIAGVENRIFDFSSFLGKYSAVLYELFLYHLVSRFRDDNRFTQREFTKYMHFNIEHLDEEHIIAGLRNRAEAKLELLRVEYPKVNIRKLKNRYERLGLREDNAYLYFRGHNMLEQVVLRLMHTVRNSFDSEQMKQSSTIEKGKHYSRRRNMTDCLMEDINFGKYPEISKIENDVRMFFIKK